MKGQLQTERNLLSAIKSYEVVFQRYNFLHLGSVIAITDRDIVDLLEQYEKRSTEKFELQQSRFQK